MGILNLPSQDSKQTLAFRSRLRKRSSGECGRACDVKIPSRDLVMGQVKILKRGEESNLAGQGKRKTKDLVVWSTSRLGPEPDMVQRQIRASDLRVYAGSAVLTSPPPSSLPVPGFLDCGFSMLDLM